MKLIIKAAAIMVPAFLFTGCISEYPSWIIWNDRELDITAEGREYHIEVKDRTVTVNGEKAFDDDWKAAEMIECDLDQDGEPDILFLMWNHIDFGDHHPFWLERDEETLNEHVYIYNLRDGYLRPKWMSSMIDPKIKKISTDKNIIYVTDPEDEESVWAWIGFGIERIDLEEQ